MALNPELLKILACPQCKGDLNIVGNEEGLECTQCQVVYPIRNEIPVMLIDESIASDKWAQGVRQS